MKIKITVLATLFAMALGSLGNAYAETNVNTTTKSDSNVTSEGKTIVISPPPSAITPSVNSSSSDLCTVGVAGAVQTQILGISTGETVRDANCERLKIMLRMPFVADLKVWTHSAIQADLTFLPESEDIHSHHRRWVLFDSRIRLCFFFVAFPPPRILASHFFR